MGVVHYLICKAALSVKLSESRELNQSKWPGFGSWWYPESCTNDITAIGKYVRTIDFQVHTSVRSLILLEY